MEIKSIPRKNKKKGQHCKPLLQKKQRAKCDCEATQHPLVNNCILCGRIVCESEGPGPCMFCGNSVDSGLFNFKEKDPFDKKPLNFNVVSEDALRRRDKLLDFDKNETSRTSVIDDECDYFSSNNMWLSSKDRKKLMEREQELQDQKHESRMKKQIEIDFSGRVCVDEDEELIKQYYDLASLTNVAQASSEEIKRHYNDLPNLFDNLLYMGCSKMLKSAKNTAESNKSRVQDKNLLEISDNGACLSLHQPYASLLVRGIKKVEGRTWYSAHRGRLWIASTVKEPTVEEVKTVENHYLDRYNGNISFPQNYPTSCLLGFVNVMDVVPQEDFQNMDINDDNDSPYLFLCDNFFELPLKYPIQGKYKIYKLEQPIHRAALNVFEKATKKQETSW